MNYNHLHPPGEGSEQRKQEEGGGSGPSTLAGCGDYGLSRGEGGGRRDWRAAGLESAGGGDVEARSRVAGGGRRRTGFERRPSAGRWGLGGADGFWWWRDSGMEAEARQRVLVVAGRPSPGGLGVGSWDRKWR
ncbi:unnamed protein product [Linum trigynum]|uniref:Uncharacterized protein n=1 Tax=Linum trigynum TaxID=586398 RepID=A0AAV2G924_9ROSI